MVQKVRRGLGWHPQLPDARDYRLALPAHAKRAIPPSVDWRSKCPSIRDQGQLGSCTAFGITGALEFQHMAQGLPDVQFSELFVYYLERRMEGTIRQDSGATIRDGMKCINLYGAALERAWPYNPSSFMRKPPKAAWAEALAYRTVKYSAVAQDETDLKAALASGLTIVFGFTVYTSFMSDAVAQTGIVPMPDLATEGVQGGHCVECVGYNTADGTYVCRNSWGTGWGQAGYFTMPASYVESPSLASDFWVIQVSR